MLQHLSGVQIGLNLCLPESRNLGEGRNGEGRNSEGMRRQSRNPNLKRQFLDRPIYEYVWQNLEEGSGGQHIRNPTLKTFKESVFVKANLCLAKS